MLSSKSEMNLHNRLKDMTGPIKKGISFLTGVATFLAMCALQYVIVSLITGLLPDSLAGWSAFITWAGFILSLVPTVTIHLTVAIYVWASVYSMLIRPKHAFIKYRNSKQTAKANHEQNKD